MHYVPGKDHHGLPHDPFKSCVIPRPIGWISSLSPDGIPNLAPFSQFQNLGYKPPYVMFSANEGDGSQRRDSVNNIEATGEFVWNMATYELRDAVNKSAQDVPPEVDEFEIAGVTKAPSIDVKPFRVAESPVHFECKYYSTLRLPGEGKGGGGSADVVIGKVVRIHINEAALTKDGLLDVTRIRPIARLGYYHYTSIDSVFEMIIPNASARMMQGLEGQTSGPRAAQ
jgi:flavin reductase (DIM6/NTAB) family NADH-FMN oxidoreductase RutF